MGTYRRYRRREVGMESVVENVLVVLARPIYYPMSGESGGRE